MSIIVDNISYIYEKGTGFERQALKNVSCAIEDGEFIGLLKGHLHYLCECVLAQIVRKILSRHISEHAGKHAAQAADDRKNQHLTAQVQNKLNVPCHDTFVNNSGHEARLNQVHADLKNHEKRRQ